MAAYAMAVERLSGRNIEVSDKVRWCCEGSDALIQVRAALATDVFEGVVVNLRDVESG
jgi:hypothetical protein